MTKYWHTGCQNGVHDFLTVPLKGKVITFPRSFLLFPSVQNVVMMVTLKMGMGRAKERRNLSPQCCGYHQVWTHVQTNICVKNKLLFQLGVHCLESLLQLWNLWPNAFKMVLSCTKAQWERCHNRLAMSITRKRLMVSCRLWPLTVQSPTYARMENSPKKLSCKSYLTPSLGHLPSFVLLLTTSNLDSLYLV